MISDRQNLSALIEDLMNDLISKKFKDLTEFLSNKIESEYSYINYDHDEFVKLKNLIYDVNDYFTEDILKLVDSYNLDSKLMSKENCLNQIKKSIKHAKAIKENEDKNKHKRQKVIEIDEWEVDKKLTMANGVSASEIERIITVRRSIYIYFDILKKSYKADVPKCVIMYLIDRTTKEMNSRLHNAVRKQKDLLLLVSESKDIVMERQIAVENIARLEEVKAEIRKLKRDLRSSNNSLILDNPEDCNNEGDDEEVIMQTKSNDFDA